LQLKNNLIHVEFKNQISVLKAGPAAI